MSEAPLGLAGGSTDHVTMVTDPQFESPLFLETENQEFPSSQGCQTQEFSLNDF